MLDCEQSLFFFRFQGGVHAPVSVSRAFCSTDQEKRETARIVFLQFIYLGHTYFGMPSIVVSSAYWEQLTLSSPEDQQHKY